MSNYSESVVINTRYGRTRIYKIGNVWMMRKQHNKVRITASLKTDDYSEAVRRAEEYLAYLVAGAKPISAYNGVNETYEDHCRSLFVRAKKSAKARDIDYDLTPEDVEAIIRGSGGACQVTGLLFSAARPSGASRSPFLPSLDRINSDNGYTRGNVRIVCVAVNWALSDWGIEVFEKIAGAYCSKMLQKQTGRR